MPEPNLKVKFRRMWVIEKMGNGYRWATVEEVRNHFDTIARLGIPPHHIPIEGGEKICLLDGYMTYPSHPHFQLQQTFKEYLEWKVVVKEKEWDEDARTWRTKSSACSSGDGLLVRKELYCHIPPLSYEAREVALINCYFEKDPEVLYWLLTTTSSSELERFRLSFNKNKEDFGHDNPYIRMVDCLLSCKLPFHLPLELDSHGNTAIHYAIQYTQQMCGYHYREWKNFAIYVVELLLELFSDEIVHWENSNGISFFDMAQQEADEGLIPVFTKLLTVSQRPLENHLPSIKPRFELVLFEAVERGYGQLVEKLLDFKMIIDASLGKMRYKDKKTLLHYAAEAGNPDVFQLLLTSFDSVKGVDQFGQNVLHCAAKRESGHRIVDTLKEKESALLDLMKSRDNKGRTPLHIASSKGNKKMVDKLLALLGDDSDKVSKYVRETDSFSRTALQMASRGGHTDVVTTLMEEANYDPVRERDAIGKTLLHYAAQAIDPEDAEAVCKQLLEDRGRDDRSLSLWASAGRFGTADEGENVHPFVKAFLESEKATDKAHLLRQAALQNNVEMAWELLNRGADIDDLRDPQWDKQSYRNVKDVLRQLELLKEQGRDRPSMEDKLGRNVFAEGLASLFLNRFIESPITVGIYGEWGMGKSSLMIQMEKILLITAAQLTFPNLLKFENFVGAKKISLSMKGRKIYQSIRTGASSLFVQGEDRSEENEESGSEENEENRSEEILLFKLYHKLKELVKNFWPSARHRFRGKDPLVQLLQEYQPQYHAIYKSLACMDSQQMVDSPKKTTISQQGHALRQVPRILTIQYNAWYYRDQHEAWAGLAVTITKEIEKSMTRAQWLSTCWRYTWNKNNVHILFQVFLPCFLATFLAGWIAWAVWILLKQAKFKDLKYGSIPLTIIGIVWIVLKSVMSVVKPVSVQMLGYITTPDHTNQLGYQEQVISDINFLKKELGNRPHRFFSFLSGEWCWDWFGLCADNVENTSVRKFRPASEDQLRIITFVDDLDRCEEKVILQVLSAVNLVLARCEINVVMGIDKKMIERAIRRSFEDVEDNDLAEKFLCKIIQIPLCLPDPTESQTNKFIEYHLGDEVKDEISFEDDDTDYDTADEEQEKINSEDVIQEESIAEDVIHEESIAEDVIHEEIRTEDVIHEEIRAQDVRDKESKAEDEENIAKHDDNTVVDINSSNPSQTKCQGVIKKAADWLTYLLKCSFSIACNISSELKHTKGQSDDENLNPLASLQGSRLMREMLLSKYSKEEADTFKKLKRFATGSQKLPREWKRLFNYHRLAWNVLSKRGDVFTLPTWKVELVVWIFVCWQWKHEMNTLIKGWSNFASTAWQKEGGDERGGHGPSLCEIVENFTNSDESKQSQGNSTAKKGGDLLKVRGYLRQEKLLSLYVQGHARDVMEEGSSYYSWNKLKKALQIQDVSMKGIQLFQQFRLHCETEHLPWPVTD